MSRVPSALCSQVCRGMFRVRKQPSTPAPVDRPFSPSGFPSGNRIRFLFSLPER
ncbi:hypothetical protein BD410DRAFT_792517 [Rickenella mellea]|uniref:Uncharacterized protein n=1 Tax=Rickenella mellea TaxID=50990 RepID=A0A4Y7PVD1_9AGAM|nr:hypothetical protein BD410DRAFT_792517 [Rickenella mellea]